MMWWTNAGWSAWGWFGMSLGMIAFWALVIWGVVAIVRTTGTRPTRTGTTPEEVLAERYARGEIDEDEYTRRRETLRAGR